MKQGEAREYLQFLLDGLKAFHPKIFEIKAEELEVWEGWYKKDFVPLVLNITQSKTVNEAKVTLEIWLSTPEATRNVPLAIIEAAREAKEVTKAPSLETQKAASEVLLAKSSNLKAEIEASGQPVLKPPSPQVPTAEAVTPTKPPFEVVGPAPTPEVFEGVIILRPLRGTPSLTPDALKLSEDAAKDSQAFRENIRKWIREAYPQASEQNAETFTNRLTERLVAINDNKPSPVATLKAISSSPEVLEKETQTRVVELAKQAESVSKLDRKFAEAAISSKISPKIIEEVFAQDEVVYQVVPEIQEKDVLIKAKPFIAKVESAVVKGQVVEITKEILPASAVLPTQESPETFYIRPVMRVTSAKLPKPAEKSLTSMQDSARQNALNFISELKQQVAQNIPSEVKSVLTTSEVEAVSETAAEEFTQRLLNPDEPTFLDLTSPDNEAAVRRLFVQKEIKEKFQALANQAVVVERANQELMARAVDKEIVDALYEPNKIEVVEQVSAEAHEVATADIVSSLDTKVAYVQKSLPAYHLILSETTDVGPQTRAAARLLGITIVKASPKAQILAQSATTKSLKFAIDLGAETLAKTSPDEATALKLLSLGIGSEQTKSLVVQAQKLGLEKEVIGRLQNLERIIKAFEETRPEFLQMVSAQGVEIKLLTEYSEILTSQITLQPTEASYVFSPQSFQVGGFQGLAQRLFGRISSRFLDRFIAPAKEKIFSILGGKAKGKLAKLALGKSLKAGVKGLAIKAVTRLGLKGLFTKIGAFLGSFIPIPIVGQIIGALVGLLSSFALSALSWLKRKISQNRELILGGLAILAGAILLGIPGLVIPGLLLVAGGIFTALGAGTISALGFGGALSAAGGVVSAAIAGFFTFTIGLVAAPIFIISVILILLTALIIFIINSGAYIVPPQGPETSGFVESAFIGVEKVAEPPGPFKNGELPIAITYTITVTAKKGTLTNISFSHDCQVIKEGSPPSCSAPTPAVPTLISPVEPFVFTYTQTYPTPFTDSAVVNTFTVVADSPERARERASASYSITIGEPPTGCFEFTGFRSDDPDFAKFQAAAAVVSSHKNYASKLCSGGPITIQRLYSGGGTAACAGAARNSIFFQNCTFYQTRGQAFVTYLFAHETGHVYWFMLGHEGFILSGGPPDTEGWLPTYCLKKSDFEDFAETAGDYIDTGALGGLCAAPDQRPLKLCGNPAWTEHCRFAREVLFQE